MAAVGFVALLALLALAVPFFVYGMLETEDPDRTTSWGDARSRARNDRSSAQRRHHRDGQSSDGDDESDDGDGTGGRDDSDDANGVEGNHWG